MRIVWTEGAANDLADIADYIAKDSPDAVRRIAKFIYDQISSLASMPYRGRNLSSDSGKELVFTPWPYVAIYEIIDNTIFIEGIRHTARDVWQRP